ncbi:hypothetical protein [Nostoc sp.]
MQQVQVQFRQRLEVAIQQRSLVVGLTIIFWLRVFVAENQIWGVLFMTPI